MVTAGPDSHRGHRPSPGAPPGLTEGWGPSPGNLPRPLSPGIVFPTHGPLSTSSPGPLTGARPPSPGAPMDHTDGVGPSPSPRPRSPSLGNAGIPPPGNVRPSGATRTPGGGTPPRDAQNPLTAQSPGVSTGLVALPTPPPSVSSSTLRPGSGWCVAPGIDPSVDPPVDPYTWGPDPVDASEPVRGNVHSVHRSTAGRWWFCPVHSPVHSVHNRSSDPGLWTPCGRLVDARKHALTCCGRVDACGRLLTGQRVLRCPVPVAVHRLGRQNQAVLHQGPQHLR